MQFQAIDPVTTRPSPIARARKRVTALAATPDSRNAVGAFLTRVAGAGILYVTQILLARWVGAHEFGLYVYAWTLLIIAGDLVPTGLPFAALRIIPELQHAGQTGKLRGFLSSSVRYCVTSGVVVAALATAVILAAPGRFADAGPWVLILAALALPAQTLSGIQDGIARSFGRINLALFPPFVGRPILMIGFVELLHVTGVLSSAGAVGITGAATLAAWIATLAQGVILRRQLREEIGTGPAHSGDVRQWLGVGRSMMVTWMFVSLFTNADILILNHFAAPDQVAVYYASTKTLALAAFITYAVAAVTGPRFAARHVAGDLEGMRDILRFSVKATFWPTLAITLAMAVAGRFILGLFGAEFATGYTLLLILSVGLVVRAAVGPAERLLQMTELQHVCTRVYVLAFLAVAIMAVVLVPFLGAVGAAIAMATGMVVESGLLALAVHQHLGLRAYIGG